MSESEVMRQEPEFAALVGIDWADLPNETHRCLRSLVQQSCEIVVDTL
jgi:hypothetical protein